MLPPAPQAQFLGENQMNPKRFFALLFTVFVIAVGAVTAQESSKPKADPEPRAKDGKKLLTAVDLLKVHGVSAPRISPDGSRVLYTVSEIKMEKDKEWKSVTQIWVVPTVGGKARRSEERRVGKECRCRLSADQ